jgi:hypothetical protein
MLARPDDRNAAAGAMTAAVDRCPPDHRSGTKPAWRRVGVSVSVVHRTAAAAR